MYTISKICDLIRNEWSFFSESYYDLMLKRDNKNIYTTLKSIIGFFKDRESDIITYSPWLRQRFELTIASVYKDNQTYVVNEAAYLFLTAAYLIVDKYQFIQYSTKKGREITWEEAKEIKAEFVVIFTEILKYQYRDQANKSYTYESEKEHFKKSLVDKNLINEYEDAEALFSGMIELFEELISRYLYSILDLDLELEGMTYKLNSLLITSDKSDEELQKVLEEMRKLITLKLKIMKSPPRVL